MRAKDISLIVVLAILIASPVFFMNDARSASLDPNSLVKVGDASPKFTLQTLDGRTLNASELKGKVVLINFFATWCGPCVAEMPLLQNRVYERYKSNPTFVMVGVGREHSADQLRAFAKKENITFAMAPDPRRAVYGLFAKQSIPRNYLIGPDEKIIYQSMGFSTVEFDEMLKVIDQAVTQAGQKPS